MEKQRKLLQMKFSNPLSNVLMVLLFCGFRVRGDESELSSAVGDPGMKRDGLRVGFEAWNFCNEVGEEAPEMGSPRAADCFDLSSNQHKTRFGKRRRQKHHKRYHNSTLQHKVTEAQNKLGTGNPFPGISSEALTNPDLYAAEKELYLGSLCEVTHAKTPWHFWMVMLKNGNFDKKTGLCPENGKKPGPFVQGNFPCFGIGCMNQPSLYHQRTELFSNSTMRGGFRGSYDLGIDVRDGLAFPEGVSFYEVVWEKRVGVGGWEFHHKLKTSRKYPWLMLYLRADATKGFSGGYHYDTRGMLKVLPESPNFKVKLTLNIKQGGGPKSQFYLIDIGSCWKNDGSPCDGDTTTDVTRYSEMIINPDTPSWCSATSLRNCPPYHITPENTKIHRNDTENFPYSAYHYYCAPGNAEYLEEEAVSKCDPYSNPQAQELVQLLPHQVWGVYGYPTRQGDGWVGDGRTWELDVGGLSSRLYFYQDPGSVPARRIWTSIDVGTEIFVSGDEEVAEWTLSDFDVFIKPAET